MEITVRIRIYEWCPRAERAGFGDVTHLVLMCGAYLSYPNLSVVILY